MSKEPYKFSVKYRTTEDGKHVYKNADFSIEQNHIENDYFIQIGKYIMDLLQIKEETPNGAKRTRLSEKVVNECIRLLIALRSHHNKADNITFPSQATLERETGLDVKEIKRASDILEDMGVIVRKVKREGTKEKIFYTFPLDEVYMYGKDKE